jgi:predicted DNA-binding protein
MGKANISFPDGMLEKIDRRAAAAGTTRSGFVQEAAARYLAELDAVAEQETRRTRIKRAQQRMADLGSDLPPGPDGITLIRQMRDAVPEWLTARDGNEDD